MNKLMAVRDYTLDRLSEPSTWQGIGFAVSLFGSQAFIGLDWGQGAALGGLVSAAIKTVSKG